MGWHMHAVLAGIATLLQPVSPCSSALVVQAFLACHQHPIVTMDSASPFHQAELVLACNLS
eukprot:873732-Amphidinium_carterae.1